MMSSSIVAAGGVVNSNSPTPRLGRRPATVHCLVQARSCRTSSSHSFGFARRSRCGDSQSSSLLRIRHLALQRSQGAVERGFECDSPISPAPEPATGARPRHNSDARRRAAVPHDGLVGTTSSMSYHGLDPAQFKTVMPRAGGTDQRNGYSCLMALMVRRGPAHPLPGKRHTARAAWSPSGRHSRRNDSAQTAERLRHDGADLAGQGSVWTLAPSMPF